MDWFGRLIVVFHIIYISLFFMFFHPKYSTAVVLPNRAKIHCLPLIHMVHGRHLPKDWFKNIHFLVYRFGLGSSGSGVSLSCPNEDWTLMYQYRLSTRRYGDSDGSD